MTTEIATENRGYPITLGNNIFSGSEQFELAQRMCKALSASTVVPKDYQNNIGNCLIALEMANRLKTSPLMVMQNLYIVNGRPAWSSQYIIAMINSSKKYKTELQFELTGQGEDMQCYAWAEDYAGHKVVGPTITMKMAKAENWVDKNGSKWKTMPEVMMRYRAASFFGRLNCPDMIMGIYSADEIIEMDNSQYQSIDAITESVSQEIAQSANQELLEAPEAEESGNDLDEQFPEESEPDF